VEEGKELCSNPLPSTYVAFDFEWSSSNIIAEHASGTTENQITGAAFINNEVNNNVLHIFDFSECDNPEHELLLNINEELLKYDFSIGWYSTGVAKYHEDTQE
jgi:hypothetical protein